jgi:hypothetical protein
MLDSGDVKLLTLNLFLEPRLFKSMEWLIVC